MAHRSYPRCGPDLLLNDREPQLPKHVVRLLTAAEHRRGDAGGFAQNVLRWVDLVVVLQRVLSSPCPASGRTGSCPGIRPGLSLGSVRMAHEGQIDGD
jgi:hypothetical protein